MRIRGRAGLAFGAVTLMVGACLAPEYTVGPGSGGGAATSASTGGGSTTQGTGGTASSGGGGGSAPCSGQSDCDVLTDGCNAGSCVGGHCVQTQAGDGTACDDGLHCTEGDQCASGVCGAGAQKDCPAAPCEIGSCDEGAAGACVIAPAGDGASCDDGDPCTLDGVCDQGNCQVGAPTSCAQLDGPCSVGDCDPQLGCIAVPANEGAGCDDALYCTIADQCTSGACTGGPRVCPPPANACAVGACDEALDACGEAPGNNGTFCDDGNPCTTAETCAVGLCTGGALVGGACDDGDACTTPDACVAGACTGAPVACMDGDGCCPAGCLAQGDVDCIYWKSGVQKNVDPALFTGWTQCYSGTYDTGLKFELPEIMVQCSKARLMLACRPVGAATFNAIAMAPRDDVLFDCGTTTGCTHPANGVGWYYSDNFSWGFAPAGQAVNRANCDTNMGNDRLCWFTDGQAGFKCGTTFTVFNTWERAIYQAD